MSVSFNQRPKKVGSVQVEETENLPDANTYWVVHGRLAAGGYPLNPSRGTDRQRLAAFLECGFLDFVDLTELGELDEYAPLLEDIAAEHKQEVSHTRFPIVDRGIPSPILMDQLVAHLSKCLENDRRTYIHCLAGVGRTGIAVGCYLAASEKIDALGVLGSLRLLRSGIEKFDRFPVSPSLAAQRAFLLKWVEVRRAKGG
ncbi:hypothetical protein G3N96_00425 [Burkholderia sp. Se-20373]|uniref:protein-tyrosine phosphatase family protein n=1 Tax=Burkholderia sp. Se-20373 TaxID=2703898 RepID=UPI00197F0B05|nr:dual specificity protein phosphatase family protein [Burkholderia sp. Se-20373]MBN3743921.1 hypothetical protein [Burkholderia sp. Se-20373]